MAIVAVPASIAVSEILLVAGLLFRAVELKRGRGKLFLPRVFWFWFAWAMLEIFAWLRSPELVKGKGEIRHLFLLASLFFLVPALDRAADRIVIWRGIILTATLSSMVLIGHFVAGLLSHDQVLDPVVYLRNGGLLHHWMIYGTVEILVFAGLLELSHFYPEERWWLYPVLGTNVIAILLSLTRMLWICCLILWLLHLIWSRSRWVWVAPLVPCLLLLAAPGAVRSRVIDSVDPAYYSNAERLQMLSVGWDMIRENPFTGIGPGRVDEQYKNHLAPGDALPAFHGHLHNNIVQVAAEFGLVVAGAMLLFVAALGRDLIARCAAAGSRAEQFLCRTSLLGLAGFIVSGMFDYTYGHSLGLILLSFVVLLPLAPTAEGNPSPFAQPENCNQPVLGWAHVATDRAMGLILVTVLSPVIVGAAGIVLVLSRRSPLVAHLRIGQGGRPFWMWKLRTMWPSTAPSDSERVWLQRIEADPKEDEKLQVDPRITSRFAAFCRRHSIDELPQLVHVIQGEMSLVGPRPVTRAELTRHYGVDAEEVLRIKPGLTGYWQTQGRSRLSYQDRVSLDLALARTLSFGTYWSVMWRTLPEVLSGKNAR